MNKINTIIRIKNIIEKYGETNSTYLKVNISPNNTVTAIIKNFNKNDVIVEVKLNNSKYNTQTIPYEDLLEPILNKILKLLKQYEKRKVKNKYLNII
jgi:hypothetical protein